MGPPSNSKFPSALKTMLGGNSDRSTSCRLPAVGISSHLAVLRCRPMALAAVCSREKAWATAALSPARQQSSNPGGSVEGLKRTAAVQEGHPVEPRTRKGVGGVRRKGGSAGNNTIRPIVTELESVRGIGLERFACPLS
eukprot:9155162-Karenia_brevis.AAC.1